MTPEQSYGKAKMLRIRADELVDEGRYVDAEQMQDAAEAIDSAASQQAHPWRTLVVWLSQSLRRRLRQGLFR